MKFNIEL